MVSMITGDINPTFIKVDRRNITAFMCHESAMFPEQNPAAKQGLR